MRRKGWWKVAGSLVLAALLGLTGPAAVEAQAPIKIGLLHPESGTFAQVGADMRDGFLLYLSEVGGKAGGRTIETLPEGHATNKADEGLTKARKLVERDGASILTGVIETPIAIALRGYVIEKKIPFVIMNAGADDLTQKLRNEFIFRSAFSNSDASHPLGEWAAKQGYKKMVLIASDFGAGYEQIGGVARTFIQAGGQVIQEIYPPLGSTDFAPFITQIKRDADVVAVFFAGADALRFVQQYAEYGLKGKIPLIGKGFLTDEVILPKQGEAAVGVVTSLHWSAALDTPANKRFLEAYQAKYKRPATNYAEQGYVGAQMIVKALEATKGNIESQQAFLAALAKGEVDAPRGKVRLDAYHNPVHTIYIRKVEKKGNDYVNAVIANYPSTSQFWKLTPEAYLAQPSYPDMKNKWAK